MITKELIARRLLRVACVLLLIWLFVLATSCGSKKKAVQKTQFSTQIAKVERVSELTQKDVKTDISVSKVEEKKNVTVHENFQGEVEDPTKEATVTVENLDGKKVYTYTNFKNVTSGNHLSESETNKISESNLSEIDKSKTSKQAEAEARAKATGQERNVDVAIERGFPWWLVLIICIATILYLAISYFHRTLNPLRW